MVVMVMYIPCIFMPPDDKLITVTEQEHKK